MGLNVMAKTEEDRLPGNHGPTPGPSTVASQEPLQIVAFKVGPELFGLDIHRVQEIIRDQHLTRVPNAPDFVEGVINLRGKIVPIIALGKRFGTATGSSERVPRIVILDIQQTIVGFSVDSVPEVLRVEPQDVVACSFSTASRDYVSGMAKLQDRLVILIEAERVIHMGENISPAASFSSR